MVIPRAKLENLPSASTVCQVEEHSTVMNEEEEKKDNFSKIPITVSRSSFVKKRTKPCVVRYKRFIPAVALVEYFRQIVLLCYSS